VPLDQFKTQVLLLHSEQSALDSLSSGFSDRYTVHCATSGTEALTTLGETPINVIICAQSLPGMSGIEALREAKKRSPETIGILLAGNNDSGLEALVSDKEVFQIVRGQVTGESLTKLVDGATQHMRLMALAESANDMAANLDEPAEHIIMETSENGSTIISDGTGRMPVLNPKKISAAVAIGSQAVDVLVLTKDQEFLSTIKESSRGTHHVHYANTLKQADELIRKHTVGVAVIDAAMVGRKVEQLSLHLRKGSPRLVSIVAGRRDDGEMLMDLINRSKVYRFLLKPVSPGRARLAVEASVKHHLEAPDAAFKLNASPAPAPNSVAQARPKANPAPKPAVENKPQPQAAPKAANPNPAAKPAATPAAKPAAKPAPVDPPLGDPPLESPVDDGLSSAFGGNNSNFAETVTGIIGSVSEKLKGDSEQADDPGLGDTLAGLESPAVSGDGTSSGKQVKIIGIAAVAVAAAAAAGFWFMSGDEVDAPAEQETVSQSAPPVAGGGPGFDAETVFGVDIDAELVRAETALLESRLDDASTALQNVAEVEPDHARLPFLNAQLAQLQLRGYLTDARAAIRDTRFEDAGNALTAARLLDVGETTEIDAVMEEFSNARSQQRVDETLALAGARLEEGDLLSPPNDNARYYYELVLSSDSSNTSAQQGLDAIANKLVLQARSEIDAGNLGTAENLLADARAIDPISGELTATEAALQAARDEIAERDRRVAEERRQAEAERQAQAQREAEAKRLAEEERQAAARAEAESAATEDPSPQAAEVSKPLAEDTTVAAEDGRTAGVGVAAEPLASESPRQAIDPSEEKTVAISTLTRTKYVAPRYPRAAQRRGESGWVDVVFTVGLDGSVTDIEVRGSQPEGMFENSASRAVEKWTFEPVIENGQAVQRRAGVRMMFALE
jgi:TonB family protein